MLSYDPLQSIFDLSNVRLVIEKVERQKVVRVYDNAGNVIETYKQAGDFKEW